MVMKTEFDKFYNEQMKQLTEELAESPQTDTEILRLAIQSELDAINLYDQLAAKASNEDVKKVLLDISAEEKVHVSEFETVLKQIDPQEIGADIQAKKEVIALELEK
jgi:rubrerythrin